MVMARLKTKQIQAHSCHTNLTECHDETEFTPPGSEVSHENTVHNQATGRSQEMIVQEGPFLQHAPATNMVPYRSESQLMCSHLWQGVGFASVAVVSLYHRWSS